MRNKYKDMSLDQIGAALEEIAEALREKVPNTPLAKMQVQHAIWDLESIGPSVRDAFTRGN